MAVQLEVFMLSGRAVMLDVEATTSMEELRESAQRGLGGVCLGVLRSASGDFLRGATTVEEAGLKSGDRLIFQVRPMDQVRSRGATAEILGDGSVVTSGHPQFGSDSTAVQEQLFNVQQVYATDSAFAALLFDGSVVTWGDRHMGGNSRWVQKRLKNVVRICPGLEAFAAIRADGLVVTWGNLLCGGDSGSVHQQLRDVRDIKASHNAFAALREDGSVVTWGDPDCGGNSDQVQRHLKNVLKLYGSSYTTSPYSEGSVVSEAFAALRADGTLITWGNPMRGGSGSPKPTAPLTNVEDVKLAVDVSGRGCGFVATLGNGTEVYIGKLRRKCAIKNKSFRRSVLGGSLPQLPTTLPDGYATKSVAPQMGRLEN